MKIINKVTMADLEQQYKGLASGSYAWIDFPWQQICGVKADSGWIFSHGFDDEDLEFLESARFFNPAVEIGFFPTGQGFVVRTLDVATDCKEFTHIIAGTSAKNLANGFTELYEDRGTSVIVPWAIPDIEQLSPECRLCMRVSYHINYDQWGLASYGDCRFIGFEMLRGRNSIC
ncbi:MAG: hypothetical protein H3C47_14440 [Candidatus Cloacimonetes bacterium]|nr:hypothetical protein [Candidatus Cloacimonadota bacterium]